MKAFTTRPSMEHGTPAAVIHARNRNEACSMLNRFLEQDTPAQKFVHVTNQEQNISILSSLKPFQNLIEQWRIESRAEAARCQQHEKLGRKALASAAHERQITWQAAARDLEQTLKHLHP